MSLQQRAASWLLGLAAVMALLIFLSAGNAAFWRGWLFLAVYLGAAALVTLDLAARDPALLERRMKGGPTAETAPAQKVIMAVASASFVALMIIPPLAYRIGWAPTSAATSVAGDGLVAIGFYGVFLVFRENSFAAATIGLADEQKVISTGPYSIVRHPMYANALVYLVGTPLALGSWWGFAPLAVLALFLVWRLFDEEKFLAANLVGYRCYMAKVRWRLISLLF